VEHLANILGCNHTLIKLNLSSNNFGPEDISILADGLKHNRTLLQLSFENNAGTLDAKGFLQPIKNHRDKTSENPLTYKPGWMNDYHSAFAKGMLK
jgi:hypothetical protein